MSCRVINSPITGKEETSRTWEILRDQTDSDVGADDLYNEFFKPDFINWFGNWVEDPKIERDVNEIGEPTFTALTDWFHYVDQEDTKGESFLQVADEERLTKEATPQQVKKFREWAKRAGLEGRYLNKMIINGKQYNASGIAKIAQNLYYVIKGKEQTSEVEEIMHFAVNAISQTQPGLFNQMLNKIGNDPIYQPTFDVYKGDKSYRTEDGRPDIRKIKEEAITKRLVNVLLEKESQGFWADTWEKIKSWFLGLINKADFDPFEVAAEKILKGETFGAENSESLKQIAFRVMKTNPTGTIGQEFRDLYDKGKYREALILINDSLESDREFTIEEVLRSQSLAELIEFTLGKTFSQIPSQQSLYDSIKTNKGVTITKEINPDQKEEDGTPKQMYKVNGEWVKRRVTDLAKAVYNRIRQDGDINKSQYQKAVDEIKRNYGVEGHKDIEHAFDVLVDENGLVRVSPLDDNDYQPATNVSVYKLLRDNLHERLITFPAGTRFLSEVMIHDPKKNIAGTIDFLAIEPDGKTSILDWKFMDLNTDQYNEVPWYKKRAFRIQITEYRRILNETYGVPLPDFKRTEAIPIKANYTYEQAADGKKYPVLTGIIIGNVNAKLEDADYLLPVPLESQSTGDKELDKLLRKLMGLRTTLEDAPSKTFEQKFHKAEQLNILEKAIRHIQVKQSIKPFVEQADIFTKEVQNIIDTYEKTLKDKDFKTLENKELSDYGIRLNRAFDEIKIYTNLDNEVATLFKGTLSEADKKLWGEIQEIVSNARRLEANLKSTAEQFGDQLAIAKEQKGLLDPEPAVNMMKRAFNETSKLPTTALKAFYEYRREAENNEIDATAQESEDLVKLEEEYEKLAKSKGWNSKNYFDIVKKKKENELIDQYQIEFYKEAKKAVREKNYQWIKENVDTTAYKAAIEEDLKKKIALINARPWTDARKNEAINLAKAFSNTIKKDSIGWFNNRRILTKFPLQKWESNEWKELNKPENKAAKDLYDWILKINKKAEDIGYLPDHKAARTFLPFVPKSLMEGLIFGSEKGLVKNAAENFLRGITVDEDTVGYGTVDPLTGQLINRIPRYLIGNSQDRELSNNLIRNLALYNEFVNKYKYVSEMEGIALALGRVERNKPSILTSDYGVPVFNKEKNDHEIIESNSKNADLYDKQIATLIYGQKYVNSEKFDQMLGRVNDFTTGINKKLGFKLLPENLDDKQLSLNKFIDSLNNWFQMKALGLSPLPAASNFIGGNLQLQINAGKYFTKMDVLSSELQLFSHKLTGEDGKKIMAALKYFIPFTRDINRDVARKLSLTPLTETGIQDFLMILMRGGDWAIEGTTFLSLLKNLIIIDGKIHNAREYVRTSNEYRDRYTDGKLQEKEEEFDKKVTQLIDEFSLMKLSKLQDNQLVIPGIQRGSEETHKVRNLSKALSKRVIGNMSAEEVRGMNQNIITNSMMIFKNWIPALADVRVGQLKYNNDIEAWEWGRMRTIMRFLAQDGVTALRKMHSAVRGTESGIKSLNEMYERKKDAHFMATGKKLDMSAEDFHDMVRSNIRQSAKDAIITISLISLYLLAKATVPDDDEDAVVISRHKFMVRALDKVKDELSFYYNPSSLQQILNGHIFPSLSIFSDAEGLIQHFTQEMYGFAFDEDMQERNYVIKYIMKSFPITSQLASYMPLYAPELAKELGIQMSSQARLR